MSADGSIAGGSIEGRLGGGQHAEITIIVVNDYARIVGVGGTQFGTDGRIAIPEVELILALPGSMVPALTELLLTRAGELRPQLARRFLAAVSESVEDSLNGSPVVGERQAL